MTKKRTIVYVDGKPYIGEYFDIDTNEYQRALKQGVENNKIRIQFYDGVPTEYTELRAFLHKWHRAHNPQMFKEESN